MNFRTIYDNYKLKNSTPPFLYPVMTFSSLNQQCENLNKRIYRTTPHNATSKRLQILNKNLEKLLYNVVLLQYVLEQRTTGLNIMNLIEYHPITQFEYTGYCDVYNAVDGLCYDLFKKILGRDWIINKRYVPISIFHSSGYKINTHTYIVCIPYNDAFRPHLWPSLAHEVAHIFVFEEYKRKGEFRSIIDDETTRLMEDVLEYNRDETEGIKIASYHLTELTSDIVGACVCPAIFYSAAMMLYLQWETKNNELKKFVRNASHPLSDVRINAMSLVLNKLGIKGKNKAIHRFIEETEAFFGEKNLFGIDPPSESWDLIQTYFVFVENFVDKIFKFLPKTTIEFFDSRVWDSIINKIENKDIENLSPVQMVNAAWLKRLIITKGEAYLKIEKYIKNRKEEQKIFEELIYQFYKYWIKDVMKEVMGWI